MSSRVLVDSSSWADYLRGRGRQASQVLFLLAEERVWLHPTVIGEVLLGGVDLRDGRFGDLPMLAGHEAESVLAWVRRQPHEARRGVGWAGCEIAHAALAHGVPLLTSDARQRALFERQVH